MTRRVLPHPGPESPDTYRPLDPVAIRDPDAPPLSPGIDAWTRNVMAGFARMARDPEYRRYIQSRIS